ncbi:molybdate ABC transporter substrate-binding protein [Paenibacillus sp. 1P07SE]|uniref:molybdate ABC transporter substrate-binding protein n=1 Tax=Paenibacillus sp. 1P07SE TaxID=3132209 RepID=UPI0039A72B85
MVTVMLLAIVILLAGCGADPDNGNTGTDTGGASGQTETDNQMTVELTISAAASLKDALMELQKQFEADHDNIKLLFNFAASGALQQQIEQGAPADLFISAAPKHISELVQKGMIKGNNYTDLLKNELVVVVPADQQAVTELVDLQSEPVRHIAIGIPESVPAGEYAKAALESAGLWEALQPKLVQAKDVRSVLQYVETGNADAGFVYRTDALSSDHVKIAFAAEERAYPPVIYPMGLIAGSSHPEQARALYDYLQTDGTVAIFEKHGFGSAS